VLTVGEGRPEAIGEGEVARLYVWLGEWLARRRGEGAG
jgi:hypothetical protein